LLSHLEVDAGGFEAGSCSAVGALVVQLAVAVPTLAELRLAAAVSSTPAVLVARCCRLALWSMLGAGEFSLVQTDHRDVSDSDGDCGRRAARRVPNFRA
jgi:hypothetical protein